MPETEVWSPVLEPETETAPAPMVRTEVLAELAVKVRVPVLTVSAVVRVALVTAPAVRPEAVPERLVAVPEDGVPKAPPETSMLAPSIETTPAETRARVVSDAAPSSIEPTPSAVLVDEVSPAMGRPVALVRVAEDGVPKAPPETKLPLAVPVKAPTKVVAVRASVVAL